MGKGRMEAFSDGVIAVIITIMVLEMKAPHGHDWAAIKPVLGPFFSYILSFVFIGIYWNNHHHLLHASKHVTGGIMWANLHLLFWLSLVPFLTEWMNEDHYAPLPVALYGAVLLASGMAFTLLARLLIARHGKDSTLAKAIGSDMKGYASLILYSLAIPGAFINTWISAVCYVVVAIFWLVPERRIERALAHHTEE